MSEDNPWGWVWDRFHSLDAQGQDDAAKAAGSGGILGNVAGVSGTSPTFYNAGFSRSGLQLPAGGEENADGGMDSAAGLEPQGILGPVPDLNVPARTPSVAYGKPGDISVAAPTESTPFGTVQQRINNESSPVIYGTRAAQNMTRADGSGSALAPFPENTGGATNVTQDDRWQGLKDAPAMTADWAFGLGPADRAFQPGSIQVTEMMNAPGVDRAREYFYAKNAEALANGEHENLQPVTNYAAKFGLGDLLTNGSPTQQFVGSYGVDIKPIDNAAKLQFTLTNDSSFKSLGYGLTPAWERSSFRPGGNMRQTYTWSEPMRQR